MVDLFRVRDYGYEQLTELTLDGLLTRLTETTWVRAGALLGPEDRMNALAAQIPARLVVSHGTAWWVHVGLGRAPSPLSFITYPRRRTLEQAGLNIHELNLRRDDCETIAGFPVTTPMRTLYDVLLPHVRAPEWDSGRAVAEIVADVPVSLREHFRYYLEAMTRRPFAAQMREVFDRYTDTTPASVRHWALVAESGGSPLPMETTAAVAATPAPASAESAPPPQPPEIR